MGSQTSLCTLLLIFAYFSTALGQRNDTHSHESLDVILQQCAFKSLAMASTRTGILYQASLPSNLTGIKVSAVRLRSGSFFSRGANFSGFDMPPRIIPVPFVTRLDIVYQNLGNWSDFYYNVRGYTMVTPVLGFMAYNASNTSVGYTKLNLTVTENPISVRFSSITLPKGSNSSTLRCVKFRKNGTLEFSTVRLNHVCLTRDEGHFAVVVALNPSPQAQPKMEKMKKERLWKWLVAGFVLGFVSLVAICSIAVVIYKLVKVKKMGEMEKRADEGESFDTIWIGMSKMPSATVIRTQPVLEHEEIP